jgi:hypothetical protein
MPTEVGKRVSRDPLSIFATVVRLNFFDIGRLGWK